MLIMKPHLILSVILFLVVLTVSGQVVVDNAANLGKMSYKDASDFINKVVDQNDNLIATLAKEISQTNFPADSKVCAIYLLGELRAKDRVSIQALMERIDFVAPRQDLRINIARWGMYPAEEALEKIGMPAVQAAVETYIPKEESQVKRHLMTMLLQDVLGRELAISFVEQRLAKESDPKNSAGLEMALKDMGN
jgi:hypothetical protein